MTFILLLVVCFERCFGEASHRKLKQLLLSFEIDNPWEVYCGLWPHVDLRVEQKGAVTSRTTAKTRWWFQISFIFTPIWGRFPV